MFHRTGDPSALQAAYVPILLAKRGERLGLEMLSPETRVGVTPFVRIVPPELRREDEADPPPREIARLAAVVGDRPIYLDAVGSPRRNRRPAPLGLDYARRIYEAATAGSLAFAPVYPFRRRDLAGIVQEFASPETGAAVLITVASAVTWGRADLRDELRDEVKTLAIAPGLLDAVIDLGYLPAGSDGRSSAAWLIREVSSSAPWRSLILTGSSVPDSVAAEIPDDALEGIVRRERVLFDALQNEVGQALRFGDYGVQHPVPPLRAPVPKMRASIRYTAGGVMLVSRGGRPIGEIDDVPAEYQRLATRLRDHPAFVGVTCCWGDRYIEELASGTLVAYGQHQMRAVATCHHITSVVGEARLAPAAGGAVRRGVPSRSYAQVPSESSAS
jgi:hypothetical protein